MDSIECESVCSVQPSTERSSAALRDDNYYFVDGSCIVRVEDTLFNVCDLRMHMP